MFESITISSTVTLLAIGALIGGIIAYYMCQNSNSEPVQDISQNLISNGTAISNILNKVNDNTNDAIISGHIPLNILFPYLQMLEKESRNSVKKVAGIEFYFTRYEEQTIQQTEDLEENLRYDLSFLLYPTFLNQTGEYIPFDPIASKSTITTLEDLHRKHIDIEDDDYPMKHNSIALNRANMSPPRGHNWLN